MNQGTGRIIVTPENEFLAREPELFNLYLKMPVQYREEWVQFKKQCNRLGVDFEDVLGDLLYQFNKGDVFYKGR